MALTGRSDALVADRVEHAAVDVDEVAWAYPFPTLAQRCAYLRSCCESHRQAGHQRLLVAEVIESAGHLGDVLDAVGADDHLLVGWKPGSPPCGSASSLASRPAGMGWTICWERQSRYTRALPQLDGVHLVLDTEQLGGAEMVERVRGARPDMLRRGAEP